MRAARILTLAVALLAGGCTGSDEAPTPAASEQETATEKPAAPPAQAPPAVEPPTDDPDLRRDTDGEAAIAIVRAWSAALNAGDNLGAAELFAPGALVIQGAGTVPLPDLEAAELFNASLPCSGQLVDTIVAGNVVTAVFELGHRITSQCDAPPGTLAAADFLIEDGAIAVWQLVPVPDSRNDGSRGAV